MLKPFFGQAGLEAGCDEAGRGCLAGPVFAAAVILPRDFHHPLLNDSKQLSPRDRETLRAVVEKASVSYAVARVEAAEIDEINILQASFLAMHRALEQINPRPDRILVDGNRFRPYQEIPFHTIIKGDGIYASIAAASILAKTYRDEYMEALHQEFPWFQWQANKGYPTKAHREAIRRHGLTSHHRKSFQCLPEQQEIPF